MEPDSRSLQSGSDTKSVARSSLGLDPDSRVSLSLEPEPRSPSVPEPEHRLRFNSESCVLEVCRYIIIFSCFSPLLFLSQRISLEFISHKTFYSNHKYNWIIELSVISPLVTRPVTISEVVLQGSCQNKTWLYSWKNDIQLNFWIFFVQGDQ